MSQIQVVHNYQHVSQLAKDRASNTLYIDTNETGVTLLEPLATLFHTLFEDTAGGLTSWAQYMSNAWCAANSTLTMYQLLDPKPRAPIYNASRATPIGPTASPCLPDEVAACLSYSAGSVSGIKNARRRGRIYLGPLNTDAMLSTTSQSPRPTAAFQNSVMGAFSEFSTGVKSLGMSWVQYSPTGGLVTDVTQFWIDDAFDTQRRRGVDPIGKLLAFVV